VLPRVAVHCSTVRIVWQFVVAVCCSAVLQCCAAEQLALLALAVTARKKGKTKMALREAQKNDTTHEGCESEGTTQVSSSLLCVRKSTHANLIQVNSRKLIS